MINLELLDTILLTIESAGGTIPGRTTIQKLIYFESMWGVVEANYIPHYYGPYSAEVSGTIEGLVSLNFIEEKETSFFTKDWKRYEYKLSEDVSKLIEILKDENKKDYEKIFNLVKICKENTNLNANILSCAAKVKHILSKQNKPMTYNEIINTAKSFGWKLSEDQIDSAAKLLNNLRL